jgi:hypothetical protein
MDSSTAQNAAQGAQQGFPAGARPGGGGASMLLGGPTASWVLIGLLVAMLVVFAIVFWKVSQKAGLAPWLGLLMLLPVVNLGVGLYVAFTSWPALAEVGRLKAIAASMSQWGKPADGSSTAEGVVAPV